MTDFEYFDVDTLRCIARTLFPYDHIEDEYYDVVVQKVRLMSSMSDRELIVSGLNEMSKSVGRFADLNEERRVEYLKAIEQTPFFKKIYSITVREFFNNPALWQIFEYEGPSAHRGGYVRRGFDNPYGATK